MQVTGMYKTKSMKNSIKSSALHNDKSGAIQGQDSADKEKQSASKFDQNTLNISAIQKKNLTTEDDSLSLEDGRLTPLIEQASDSDNSGNDPRH